jgi:DnaD/phage-associated family protein
MGKPWLKLWTETLHDRKLLRVDPAWRCCWYGCLMLAAEQDNHGRLELAPGIPLTDVDVAESCAIPLETWLQARAYFLKLGMLGQDGETLIVTQYDKRQEGDDPTHAERQQRYRERHSAPSRDASRDASRTTVTPPSPVRVESESESDSISAAAPDPELAAAVREFENNIGLITGSIAEDLKQTVTGLQLNGRLDWWALAIKQAVSHNKRSWGYVRATLASCEQSGLPPGTSPPGRNGHCPNGSGRAAKGDQVTRVLGKLAQERGELF